VIGIIDIQMGNINSVAKALRYLDKQFIVVNESDDLEGCTKIIFPGVGSFHAASKKLETSGLKTSLREHVLVQKKPFLGICLGMQLIAKSSEENGFSLGLNLIDAEIHKIPISKNIKIPHIGWNNVEHDSSGIFRDTTPNADFYFVHSYHMVLKEENIKFFYTDHGEKIIAYVEKNNIYGTQFHPEKSQKDGLNLLKNFSELC
jgi:glutamine amidotransferase